MSDLVEPGFRAVATTGIYCRDGCPAAPLPGNIRDYAFAAAAEADGYRPCRRCRPERSSLPTSGLEAPDLVCRALRLIASGSLDHQPTTTLARQLGVSERHLRRVFHAHVGASPDAVARSRRAHLAKRLLDDSDLAVSAIAFAAGFNSLRQMNRVMRDVFRRTPTELRRASTGASETVDDTGALVLHLSAREPFAPGPLFAFLDQRAVPAMEATTEDAYARTITLDAGPGTIEVRWDPDHSSIRLRVLLSTYRSLSHVVAQVRRLLDLDAPAQHIDEHLAASAQLRPSVRAVPGMRVPGCWDRFELAVRAVLGQQVSVAAATTLTARLVVAHGPRISPAHGTLTAAFPGPERLAGADLGALGIPASRARTITTLARAVADGGLGLGDERPRAEVVERLTTIPGIGPWTTSYIAMRAFGDRDAFPAGDVVLRERLSCGPDRPTIDDVTALAEPWRPYRSYAAIRLWHARAENPRP